MPHEESFEDTASAGGSAPGDPGTDEVRAHLIAAAEAARRWVVSRRATWTDRPLVVAPPPVARDPIVAAPPAPELREVRQPVEVEVWLPVEPEVRLPVEVVAPSIAPRVRVPTTDRVPAGLSDEPTAGSSSPHRSRKVTLAVAAAAVVVLASAAGWVVLKKGTGVIKSETKVVRPSSAVATQPTATNPPAKPTGRLEVHSTPDGATVVVDGTERGVTPTTLDGLAPGPHTVVLRGAQGSVERRVEITAGSVATIDEAIFSGWLHVTSSVDLTISEGTQTIRLNDENSVLLRPGPHTLRFENRDLGYSVTRQVVIKPGETIAISIVPGKPVVTGAARHH